MNKFKNKWSLSIKSGDEYIKNGSVLEWNDGNLSVYLNIDILTQIVSDIELGKIKVSEDKFGKKSIVLNGKNFEVKAKHISDDEIPF